MTDPAADFAASPAFRLAPVAYSIIDLDGRQVAVNDAFCQLFRTDGPMNDVDELTDEVDRDRTHAYLAALRDGSRDRIVIDKRYRRADGSTFWGRLSATTVDATDGSPAFIIGVIEDQSDQMESLAHAQAASEAKSHFVARVSHDLRTPLHAIHGLAELLGFADLDDEQRSFAEAIQAETESLRALVDDLLDLSRLESGRLELQTTPFAIRECVESTVALVRHRARDRDVHLDLVFDDEVDRLAVGDPDRIRQILLNLADNAVKFTERGGVTVFVDPGQTRESVIFSVSDTGAGIAPSDLGRIFEPFSRVDEAVAGTGLGLSIVGDLVSMMGGSISVDSELGRGSVFTFVLPLPQPGEALAAQPGDLEVLAPAIDRAPMVLVVEDSPINQLLATGQLDRLGCDHVVAPTGADALAELRARRFDLVMMDWHLPDMDGLETTRRWRSIEAETTGHHVPIVAVTARAMAGDREQCMAAGMDDFLAKPVALDDLARMLQTHAGRAPDTTASSSVEPPPPAATSTTPALDRLVEELDDVGVVATLVATYLEQLGARCDTLRTAAAETDLDGARRAAHSLKSTSATVGADDLAELTAMIERRIADDEVLDIDIDRLDRTESTVRARFARILESLQQRTTADPHRSKP